MFDRTTSDIFFYSSQSNQLPPPRAIPKPKPRGTVRRQQQPILPTTNEEEPPKIEVNQWKAFLSILVMSVAGLYIIYANFYFELEKKYEPCEGLTTGIEWSNLRDKFNGMHKVSPSEVLQILKSRIAFFRL